MVFINGKPSEGVSPPLVTSERKEREEQDQVSRFRFAGGFPFLARILPETMKNARFLAGLPSKTSLQNVIATSQANERDLTSTRIDSAPKLAPDYFNPTPSLITSQIDTAPKRICLTTNRPDCLITSQIDTAPKLSVVTVRLALCLITSQIDTAPKLQFRFRNGNEV